MAQTVTLRKKIVSPKKISLYIDYYPAIFSIKKQKDTRREFFGKFIFPDIIYEEKASIDKNGKTKLIITPVLDKEGKPRKRKLTSDEILHNKNALAFADALLTSRRNHFNKQDLYTPLEQQQFAKLENEKKQGNKSFIDFFIEQSNQRNTGTKGCWNSLLVHLKSFFGDSIKFIDLTPENCTNFRIKLLKHSSLSQNTASLYFTLFKTCLKQAYKFNYISIDINKYLSSIKQIQSKREHLTLEELQTLVKTPCRSDVIKRAALFSALTGLRFSDILNLTWENVEYQNNEYTLSFRQQKTSRLEYLPISESTLKLADQSENTNDKLFKNLRYNGSLSIIMDLWVTKAKINKHITFHCFRHTYATLQVLNGTDIYVLMKMLGHTNLSTTQIYAKVLNEPRRETTNKIKIDFDF